MKGSISLKETVLTFFRAGLALLIFQSWFLIPLPMLKWNKPHKEGVAAFRLKLGRYIEVLHFLIESIFEPSSDEIIVVIHELISDKGNLAQKYPNRSKLEQRIEELQESSKSADDEIKRLKLEIDSISREKTSLLEQLNGIINKNESLKRQITELNQSCEELTRQNAELTRRNEELKRLNNQEIERLNQNNQTLKIEKARLESENRDVKQKMSQLEEEHHKTITNFQRENSGLTQDLQQLNTKVKVFETENEARTKEIDSKNQEIVSKNCEIDVKSKEIEQLTLRRSFKERKSSVPYLSININSLFALQAKGWKVKIQCPEKISELEKKKLSVVSVIGSTGSGKSWLGNQLGSDQLPVGWQENPNSINLHYVQAEGGWFTILDSSGWNEPIGLRNTELMSQLPTTLKATDQNSPALNHQMSLYQVLRDDAVIIERLKLLYLLRKAGIVILVVSKLTEAEIEKICEIKRLLRYLAKDKTMEKAWTCPQLYILHNLSWIYRIEDVRKEIETSIEKVFQMQEEPLFNDKAELSDKANVNKKLFKDEDKFTHFVMAIEGSEAGNYYNPGPKRFLQNKLNTLENKQAMSFCSDFAEFCNRELSKTIEVDLSVQYLDNTYIKATKKSAEISPSRLFYASGCYNIYHEPWGEFKPKFSTKAERLVNGNAAHVTVELETLDSVILDKAVVNKDGLPYLKIKGIKKEVFSQKDLTKAGEGRLELNSTRQEGNYLLSIPLLDCNMVFNKDAKPEFEDLAPGVKRIKLEFQAPESIDL